MLEMRLFILAPKDGWLVPCTDACQAFGQHL